MLRSAACPGLAWRAVLCARDVVRVQVSRSVGILRSKHLGWTEGIEVCLGGAPAPNAPVCAPSFLTRSPRAPWQAFGDDEQVATACRERFGKRCAACPFGSASHRAAPRRASPRALHVSPWPGCWSAGACLKRRRWRRRFNVTCRVLETRGRVRYTAKLQVCRPTDLTHHAASHLLL